MFVVNENTEGPFLLTTTQPRSCSLRFQILWNPQNASCKKGFGSDDKIVEEVKK
jgi:hypothetical protein